jgi:hypothetical protein
MYVIIRFAASTQARSTFNHSGMSLQMRNAILVSLTLCTLVIGSALVASAQVPSAGDMQQKIDQEMANAKRSATESSSSARQGAGNVKSEAERKMEETAAQHKGQAEGKLTEEIEKVKRSPKVRPLKVGVNPVFGSSLTAIFLCVGKD